MYCVYYDYYILMGIIMIIFMILCFSYYLLYFNGNYRYDSLWLCMIMKDFVWFWMIMEQV